MRNLPASQHAECDGIVSSVSHWHLHIRNRKMPRGPFQMTHWGRSFLQQEQQKYTVLTWCLVSFLSLFNGNKENYLNILIIVFVTCTSYSFDGFYFLLSLNKESYIDITSYSPPLCINIFQALTIELVLLVDKWLQKNRWLFNVSHTKGVLAKIVSSLHQ